MRVGEEYIKERGRHKRNRKKEVKEEEEVG